MKENRSHGYQPRPWLLLSHGPRHTLGNSLDPDDVMPLWARAGHSDLPGSDCNMAFWHKQGHRVWPWSWASIWTLMAPRSVDINRDPNSATISDADIVSFSSKGSDFIIATGGRTSHSDWYGLLSSMALRQQYCPRWQPRFLAWPLIVSGVMDINPDSGCRSATDSDIALSFNLAKMSP